MLETLALIVIGVLAITGLCLVVAAANIPGKIAAANQHPQARAIHILAWVGLFTAGLGWMAALVWAHTKPPATDTAALEQRVAALEAKLMQDDTAEVKL